MLGDERSTRHHATLEERLDYLEKVMGDGHGFFWVFSTFPEIGETKDNAQSWILLNQYDNSNQKPDRRKLNPSHQPCTARETKRLIVRHCVTRQTNTLVSLKR